jgi:hypothetical protein
LVFLKRSSTKNIKAGFDESADIWLGAHTGDLLLFIASIRFCNCASKRWSGLFRQPEAVFK